MLRVLLAKSKYASSAPILPELTSGEAKFMAAFDDAADLWGRIDADATIAGFTPPLVIAGYMRPTFVTDIAAMRAAFLAVLTADNDKRMGIKERDVLFETAREYMIQYRVAVEGLLGPNHPLTQTLPLISTAPGSTPDGVTLTGTWIPADEQAEFSWPASTNANLDHYQPVENRSTDILSVSFPIGITDWKSVVRAFSTGCSSDREGLPYPQSQESGTTSPVHDLTAIDVHRLARDLPRAG
jgi:hypothetical protein